MRHSSTTLVDATVTFIKQSTREQQDYSKNEKRAMLLAMLKIQTVKVQ